jgi:hypothetical protein
MINYAAFGLILITEGVHVGWLVIDYLKWIIDNWRYTVGTLKAVWTINIKRTL